MNRYKGMNFKSLIINEIDFVQKFFFLAEIRTRKNTSFVASVAL